MTPQELIKQMALQREQVDALNALWQQLFPDFPAPAARQFQAWLRLYDFDIVVYGLGAALQQLNKREQELEQGKDGTMPMASMDIVRYASGSMKHKKLGDREEL
jgi:hypothetical protein